MAHNRKVSATDEVHAALAAFDRCFAAGDAAGLSARFSEDAQLLLVHSEPIEGRPAILAHWTQLFSAYDTSAWMVERTLVDVHADRAYALSTYSETLVSRHGGPSRLVNGRLVQFLRRDADGAWMVTVAMNAHSRPVEEVGGA
jgi:uncharacterized protein (TIGR02246 family)